MNHDLIDRCAGTAFAAPDFGQSFPPPVSDTSLPPVMVNGEPELAVTMGENCQLLVSAFANPVPNPVLTATTEVLKMLRWSNIQLPFSPER
ncbi:MAG: hypothetical protein M3Y57_18040 [Acidobacteriota bacterium]|nr:hypothetical protein [Acidobacteriota bacterium]